jgi:hypothetical protein
MVSSKPRSAQLNVRNENLAAPRIHLGVGILFRFTIFEVLKAGFSPKIPANGLDSAARNQNLPEVALINGNLQVAMKPDESLSTSLFIFRSDFAAIHHD